jgi:hypothetical protein
MVFSCYSVLMYCSFVLFWHNSFPWAKASSFTTFLDHTQRRITVGRTPLDEWSAHRRDLYLTANTTLTTDKRPHPDGVRTHSLSRRAAAVRAATGTGNVLQIVSIIRSKKLQSWKHKLHLTLWRPHVLKLFPIAVSFGAVLSMHGMAIPWRSS